METVSQLLAESAMQVRSRASAAKLVDLESDELEQLAFRLDQASRLPERQAVASLRLMARLFGEHVQAWQDISPAFVTLLGMVRGSSP